MLTALFSERERVDSHVAYAGRGILQMYPRFFLPALSGIRCPSRTCEDRKIYKAPRNSLTLIPHLSRSEDLSPLKLVGIPAA